MDVDDEDRVELLAVVLGQRTSDDHHEVVDLTELLRRELLHRLLVTGLHLAKHVLHLPRPPDLVARQAHHPLNTTAIPRSLRTSQRQHTGPVVLLVHCVHRYTTQKKTDMNTKVSQCHGVNAWLNRRYLFNNNIKRDKYDVCITTKICIG